MQLPDLLFAFIALKIIETLSWKHVTFNVDAILKLLCVRHAKDMHASSEKLIFCLPFISLSFEAFIREAPTQCQ